MVRNRRRQSEINNDLSFLYIITDCPIIQYVILQLLLFYHLHLHPSRKGLTTCCVHQKVDL